jgi:hypothetical protein
MSRKPDSREVEERLRRLPVVRAPESLWSDVQAGLQAPAVPRAVPLTRRMVRSPWLVAAALVIAVVGGGALGVLGRYGAPSRWTVRSLAGAPAVSGVALAGTGELAAGQWLVTDSLSRARLQVGKIGTAEVGPGSRVRLDRDGLTAHRLTVERGSLHAVIAAPPRLFFVQTPSALATDLGCAYTLEVDEAGASRLHVTLGWVELRQGDAVSLVPAGLVAEVEVGGRPGTPYPPELPQHVREALHRLDAGSGTDADLDAVLGALHSPAAIPTLRRQSAITLWHLLQRVDSGLRGRVYRRLAALSPPPAPLTRERLMALDRGMLDRWRADLNPMWSEEAQTWWTRLARRLWERIM